MNKMLKYLLLISITFFSITLSAQKWELIKSEENIEVYTRYTDRSSVKEVRIKATFNTDLATFMNVLDDAERYPEWVYKCSKSNHIKTLDQDRFYYYVATDLPFPASDRDMVVYSTKKKNLATGGYDTHSVGTTDFYSATAGMVQIPLFESSWKITAVNKNKVKIDYQVITEPGGRIPTWIINLGITIGPVKTMEGLRELVEK